jgi:hypothetical protein
VDNKATGLLPVVMRCLIHGLINTNWKEDAALTKNLMQELAFVMVKLVINLENRTIGFS